MPSVFVLHHERPDTGDVKLLGIYSSEVKANEAIHRFRAKRGCRKYLECFTVSEYEADKDEWPEGFVDL